MKKQVDGEISPKAGERRAKKPSAVNVVSCCQGVNPDNYLGEKPLREVLRIIQSVPIKSEKRIRELKSKLGGLKQGTAEYKKTRERQQCIAEFPASP
jgi:hypothetical protein